MAKKAAGSRPSSRAGLAELVELVYDAALEPAAWRAFLDRLRVATGDQTAAIDIHYTQSGSCNISAQVGIADDRLRSLAEHYSPLNPWMTRPRIPLTPGMVATGNEIFPEHDLVRTEFYNDWLAPQKLLRICGLVLFQTPSLVATLNVLREKGHAPFGRKELSLLRSLRPHIQRAVEINQRLDAADALKQASSEALDRLPMGVLLLDGSGRPLLANREARAILAAGDGLSESRDGLRAASPPPTEALRRLVSDAALQASGKARVGGSLALARPSLLRPLEVLVAPLAERRCLFGGPEVVVFVRDPERAVQAAPEVLQRLYGLTPAEARLAARLAEGATLQAIAAEFDVSQQTARVQLKRVFLKTGTNRQSELVRMIVTSASVL